MNLLTLSFAVLLILEPGIVVPDDLENTFQNLKEAEARKDAAQVAKLAVKTCALARQVMSEPAPESADEKDAWSTHVAYAREIEAYTEYALANTALQATPADTVVLLTTLEQQNPKSKYLDEAYGRYFVALNQASAASKIPAVAEKALTHFPDNEDLLLVLADESMTRQQRAHPLRAFDHCAQPAPEAGKHFCRRLAAQAQRDAGPRSLDRRPGAQREEPILRGRQGFARGPASHPGQRRHVGARFVLPGSGKLSARQDDHQQGAGAGSREIQPAGRRHQESVFAAGLAQRHGNEGRSCEDAVAGARGRKVDSGPRVWRSRVPLEVDLGGHHDAPGRARLARDHAKGAIEQSAIRHAGVHMIEQVLRFETQLQLALLAHQRELLEHRHIPLGKAGTTPVRERTGHVADFEPLRQAESARVDVILETRRALQSRVAVGGHAELLSGYDNRPRGATLADVVPLAAEPSHAAAGRPDHHGLAAAQSCRAGQAPSADQAVQHRSPGSLRAAEIPAALAHRDIPRVVEQGPVGDIGGGHAVNVL